MTDNDIIEPYDDGPPGIGDLASQFLNGVEQRLADMSPQQIDAVVSGIFRQDGQTTNPRALAAQQLAGYVNTHRGTIDTTEPKPTTVAATDPKRVTTATSGAGFQSGASGPTPEATPKAQAADALRGLRGRRR